jgi:hypothetical protein
MSWSRPAITGCVVVDDPVDDRVERRNRPVSKEVGAAFQAQAHVMQRRIAVPHGDDEPLADEDEDLTELDVVLLVDVPRGLQDEEDVFVVELELRPLVALRRVLDGELVETELPADGLELVAGRVVETDPCEAFGAAAALVRLVEIDLAGPP